MAVHLTIMALRENSLSLLWKMFRLNVIYLLISGLMSSESERVVFGNNPIKRKNRCSKEAFPKVNFNPNYV